MFNVSLRGATGDRCLRRAFSQPVEGSFQRAAVHVLDGLLCQVDSEAHGDELLRNLRFLKMIHGVRHCVHTKSWERSERGQDV
jgi:hypothetical protein